MYKDNENGIFCEKTHGALIEFQKNMKIHADLGTDCDTIILLETGVTNIGSIGFDSFNLRVDVRGLQVNIATLNGTPVESTVKR